MHEHVTVERALRTQHLAADRTGVDRRDVGRTVVRSNVAGEFVVVRQDFLADWTREVLLPVISGLREDLNFQSRNIKQVQITSITLRSLISLHRYAALEAKLKPR